MLTGHDLVAFSDESVDCCAAHIENCLRFKESLDAVAMTNARFAVNVNRHLANMAIDGLATMGALISATRRKSPDTSDEHHQALLPQASNQQRQPTGEKLPSMKKTG